MSPSAKRHEPAVCGSSHLSDGHSLSGLRMLWQRPVPNSSIMVPESPLSFPISSAWDCWAHSHLIIVGWKGELSWPAVAGLGVLLLLGADLAGFLPQFHAFSLRDALANGSIFLPLVIVLLWVLGHGFNIVLTFIAITRARLPLHANHLLLWLIVLPVILISETMAAWSSEPFATIGRLLRLIGATGVVYGVTATRILDVRNTFRTSLGNAVLVTITAAITLTGIAISQPILDSLSGVTAILAVAGIALILALIYQILRGVTDNLVRRAVMRSGYDPANVAAKYAQLIARQLRFDELAATAAKTLRTSVEASKGGLILLTPNGASARADVYAGLGKFPTDVLNLPSKSPVLRTMLSSRRPLLQYNIDLGKEFKELFEPEREWLQKLNMDVFVPILDGDDLSCMLAVGQRMSGDPYRRSKLDLMMSIADQTSVALNNARLFENMRTLNNEMKSLNSNLMTTNEQLEEMDRVKTDFITIASHELRTPLTQLRGYADVMDALAAQGTISPEQVTQLTTSLLTASDRLDAIIGKMPDASQIDVDAMELSFDEITIESVLKRSVQAYADAMRARGHRQWLFRVCSHYRRCGRINSVLCRLFSTLSATRSSTRRTEAELRSERAIYLAMQTVEIRLKYCSSIRESASIPNITNWFSKSFFGLAVQTCIPLGARNSWVQDPGWDCQLLKA